MRRTKSNCDGFTLVEVLVTTAIIGILIGIVLGISGVAGKKSDGSRAITDMQKISNALEAYRLEYGTFPDQLSILTNPTTRIDQEMKDFKTVDPWGRNYVYEWNPLDRYAFTLKSLGPNALDNSDDIYSTMSSY